MIRRLFGRGKEMGGPPPEDRVQKTFEDTGAAHAQALERQAQELREAAARPQDATLEAAPEPIAEPAAEDRVESPWDHFGEEPESKPWSGQDNNDMRNAA